MTVTEVEHDCITYEGGWKRVRVPGLALIGGTKIVAPCGCEWSLKADITKLSANCKRKSFAESGHQFKTAVVEFMRAERQVVAK